MPSAILVQRPREEAQADLGIRIVSVESRIESVSASSTGRGSREGGFEFSVEMTEKGRGRNSLGVRYSFSFGRPSSGQVCRIDGEAVFYFSRLGQESDLHELGVEIDNEMAVEIFRKNYETVYLLHDALGLDAPSPWITQNVSLSSRVQSAQDSSGNP